MSNFCLFTLITQVICSENNCVNLYNNYLIYRKKKATKQRQAKTAKTKL